MFMSCLLVAGRSVAGRTGGFGNYVKLSHGGGLGTGTLLASYTATGITPEYLYQSVNPYCTDKVNGDRYQSGYFNSATNGTCTGTVNSEYRTSGYSMYIEAPEGRRAAIDVKLYDARYSEAAVQWQIPGPDSCTQQPTFPATETWTTGTSGSVVTYTGPIRYQTRPTGTSTQWSATTTLLSGSYQQYGNRMRYEYPQVINWSANATTSTSVPPPTCSRSWRSRRRRPVSSPTTGRSWSSDSATRSATGASAC